MEQKALAKTGTAVITQKEAMYLLKTIWKDAPETEVIKAAILCRQYNLNPLMGHIFLIKYDRYSGRGDQRRKIGEDWAIVRGIKAKRAMAQAKHRYSYADGPRVMTEDEQVRIFGEVEADKIWAFVLVKDQNGNLYPGYGFWPREAGVYGSEKGNSPRNMAFIRAEANALDKLEPGELPGIETADESFMVGDFQAALSEGKAEFMDAVDEDIKDYWPEPSPKISPLRQQLIDKLKEQPQTKGEYAGPESSPSPEATGATTRLAGVEVGGNLPDSDSDIDLTWVHESLEELQWSDVGKWIKNKFKITGSSVRDCINQMSKEQKAILEKEIQDRLDSK